MVWLHIEQKQSSIKDLPKYTTVMHWLVFLCLVSSSRSRLLEIDGDEDSNVRVVRDMRGVQGDVGMIIGLQSVVKVRIEKMEKDMEVRSKVEEAWRTEMRVKLTKLTENLPESTMVVSSSSPPPTATTIPPPTTTSMHPVVQRVVRTSNHAGRSVLTVTRGIRIAIFAHAQPDCLSGAMEISSVKAKWRNFDPIPEVEYIKGYNNGQRLCVILAESRRARVTCAGHHVDDVMSDDNTWYLCVGRKHYGEQHIEL